MASPRAKVLFIGLDSAEPRLLLEWSRAGVLPTLRSLMDSGAWGALKCPPGQGDGALWPSLFTGVNAGRHGRYYRRQCKAGSYGSHHFDDDRDFKHEPVWSVLSRAGRKVAVLDMVRAPLAERLNGIQLADWMTQPAFAPRSWPPELLAKVTERSGGDPSTATPNGSAEALLHCFAHALPREQSVGCVPTLG